MYFHNVLRLDGIWRELQFDGLLRSATIGRRCREVFSVCPRAVLCSSSVTRPDLTIGKKAHMLERSLYGAGRETGDALESLEAHLAFQD